MFARRAWTIPAVVCALGGCSVYDASLTATQGVGAGTGGSTDSPAGSGGAATGAAGAVPGGAAGGVSGDGSGGAHAGGTGITAGAGGMSGSGGTSASGSGGASAGGASGASGAPGTGGALGGLALDLIDDMEDDDAVIDYGDGNRDGDWYAGHDATAAGTQFPGSTYQMSALDKADARYAVSKFAAMTKGMGFADWGENMGFNMKLVDMTLMKHPPYDASAYCGLHFFGKIGAGASSEVILRVPDKNSHPDGGVCGSPQKPCYLHYQKQYAFTTSWAEYAVLFTDLTRSGWPAAFDVTAIYGVELGLLPNTKFELWVDDISFLKKPASGVCPTKL